MRPIPTCWFAVVVILGAVSTQGAVINKSLTTSTVELNEGQTIIATVSITSSFNGPGEGLEQFTAQVDFHTSSPAYGEIADLNGLAVTRTASCDPFIMRNNGIFLITSAGWAMERKLVEGVGLVGGYSSAFFINDGLLVTVHNVAPTIVTPQADTLINLNEGNLMPFGAEATDPGLDDVLTYAWDLNGDGDFTDATGATTDMIDFTGWQPNTYAARLRVDDGDGGYAYHAFNLTVVPEPVAGLMLGLGLASLCGHRRRNV